MDKLFEALNITPGQNGWDEDKCEMLKALIGLLCFIEDEYYFKESDRAKDYPLDEMKIITKATGKTWEEIKELINERN